MSIIYTWNIGTLNCVPKAGNFTDYVCMSHWTLNGDDGAGHTGSVYGTASFEVDPTKPDYVPYEDLTESEVIAWTQGALGADTVTAYEENVASQIENQINPPIVTPPLPWVKPPVTE